MPFNIEKFRTNLRDYGYLDNNSFSVYVQTPPVLLGGINNQGTDIASKRIAENMAFRIDQVRAPGISLQSVDVSRYGVGPTQKQPYNAQFQEITISMLGDHYCEFWQYWYNWHRAIFEFNSSAINGTPSYSAEYKNNYSSTIMIFLYDHYGNIIQKINLFEAFPSAIRELPLSWGDPNLMRINVNLSYTEYVIENTSVNARNQQSSGNNRRTRESLVIKD